MKRLYALWFFVLLLGSALVFTNTTPGHALTTFTFTDLNPQIIGNGSIFASLDFDITNATGLTWTDFHFTTGAVGLGSATFSLGTTPPPYVGPGTATLSAFGSVPDDFKNVLDITGLSIANGTHYISTVNVAGGEFFVVGGNPTTDGGPSAVPEPSTMLLIGSGLIGLAAYGRKKFFKK